MKRTMNDFPQPWLKSEEHERKTIGRIGKRCEIIDADGMLICECETEQIRDVILGMAAENEQLKLAVSGLTSAINGIGTALQAGEFISMQELLSARKEIERIK